MKFKAEVNVIPKKSHKDAEGKKIIENLKKAHINNIDKVSVGKFYTLEVEANSYNAANAFVGEACQSVLAKDDSETFDYSIEEIDG